MSRRSALRVLVLLAALSVLAEFFIHRHAEFAFSAVPGFYAGVALLTTLAAVGLATLLRGLLQSAEERESD